MLRCNVAIDLYADEVIGEITKQLDQPLNVSDEEVHEDNLISFIVTVPEHIGSIESTFASAASVSEVERLSDTELLIEKRSSGVIPAIRRNDGRLLKIDDVVENHRLFTILVFDRESIQRIVDELEEIGDVRVDSITTVSAKGSLLSKRQSEVIQAAYEMGYFDWPRKIDAEKLADHFGIAHPTMLEHLRKAEKKIIGQQLSESEIEQPVLATDV